MNKRDEHVDPILDENGREIGDQLLAFIIKFNILLEDLKIYQKRTKNN